MTQDVVYLDECSVRLLQKNVYPTVISRVCINVDPMLVMLIMFFRFSVSADFLSCISVCS